MEEKNKTYLLMPDIHGRSFWKEGLKKRLPGEKVIFLGDYTDPYSWEHIDRSVVPEMIKEILETPDSIFLLGNHDLSYIINGAPEVRFDYARKEIIRKIFLENWDKFKLSYFDPDSGPEGILFSHAGFLKSLYHNYKGQKFTLPEISQYFEDLKNSGKSLNELMKISWYRGGLDQDGSFVWADVREHLGSRQAITSKIYQIFGHTMLKEGKLVIEPQFAMIDCQRPVRFIPDKLRNEDHIFEVL